jgi:hypothetical protein
MKHLILSGLLALGMFSAHAQVGWTTSGSDIYNPNAGAVTIGSTSYFGTKFNVFGDMFLAGKFYYRNEYNVPTATYVPINLTASSNTMSTGIAYRIELAIRSTATPTGAVYIVTQLSGTPTWVAKAVNINTTANSNVPLLRVNGNQLEVYHNHPSAYYIVAFVTGTFTDNHTVTASSFFGLEGELTVVDNKLGVGNTAPSEKLDVAGNVRFSGALMPNNAAGTSGQVLTSAGTGAPPTWTSANGISWNLTGNSGTTPSSNFVGTTDNQDLVFKRNSVRAGFLGTDNITAFGVSALNTSSTGVENTALGALALYTNTTGYDNTAAGSQALYYNTTGRDNTAIGMLSSATNTTGNLNTAMGHISLAFNTTGSTNTAVGATALFNSTTGDYNTAVGGSAMSVNTTGSYNTCLGFSSNVGASGLSNATALGSGAVANASNKIRLGNLAVTVIEGTVAYTVSDGRFKNNVEENVPGLEFIKRLRPVTYNFERAKFSKHIGENINSDGYIEMLNNQSKEIRTGFIAQEVEKVANELGYHFDGLHIPDANNDHDNYSLAYAQFVVPLVKAIQEQQVQIEDQNAKISVQQDEIKGLTQRLIALENKLGQTSGDKTQNSLKTSEVELSNTPSIVLDQNVPNPFSESTTITYSINTDFKSASIIFTDNTGKVIKTYSVDIKGKGQLIVYGANLSSGSYSYSLVVDGKTIETRKMIKN